MTNDEIKAQAIADVREQSVLWVMEQFSYRREYMDHCLGLCKWYVVDGDGERLVATLVAQREQNIRLEAAATWISAKDNPPTTGMACLVVWSGYVQRVAYRRMGLGFACVDGYEWRNDADVDADPIPDGEVTHYRPWPTLGAQVQAAPEKEE
jgi:hypothetical protein